MNDQTTQDILDAVASQLALNRGETAQGILVGYLPDQGPYIDHIDYHEGGKQIWLRLTNGEAWLLRAHQVGGMIRSESELAHQEIISSYCRYKDLFKKWLLVSKTVKAAYGTTLEEIQEGLIQAWHDDTLDDDQRRDWNRWQSGGFASDQEWQIVKHLI